MNVTVEFVLDVSKLISVPCSVSLRWWYKVLRGKVKN